MRLALLLLAVLLVDITTAKLMRQRRQTAVQPKFHFGFDTQGYYPDLQIINHDCHKAVLIYQKLDKTTNETTIRQVTIEGWDKPWTDTGDLNIDNKKIKRYLFLTCDKDNQSGLFGKTTPPKSKGYALAFQFNNNLREFLYRSGCETQWTKSKTSLKGESPLNWITPPYYEPNKSWLSLNIDRKLLTSSNLIDWTLSPTGFTLPDTKYKNFIQEIFSISQTGTAEVYWVVYIRQWESKLTAYYVGSFVNSVLTFDDPLQKFDCGPDFNELAIVSDCGAYGGQTRIGIGSVQSNDFEKLKLPITSFTAFPRLISLPKRKQSKPLRLQFKPVDASFSATFTLADADLATANAELAKTSTINFRLKAKIESLTDDVGFTVGDVAKFGYKPKTQELLVNKYSCVCDHLSKTSIEMTMLFDGYISELYGNGDCTITVLVLPFPYDPTVDKLQGYSTSTDVKFKSISLWKY